MITKSDIPDYAPATIELPNGWTAEVRVEDDPDGELSACAIDHGNDGPCSSQTGPWIGVVVTLHDADDAEVDQSSLWGIESDTDYWREVAAELVKLAAGVVLPNYNAETEETTAAEVQL